MNKKLNKAAYDKCIQKKAAEKTKKAKKAVSRSPSSARSASLSASPSRSPAPVYSNFAPNGHTTSSKPMTVFLI